MENLNPAGPVALIVDDHAVIRQATCEIVLRRLPHFIVVEVADGAEALQSARRWQPGLVLLDFHMPGMSGMEVLYGLKAVVPDARIVMMSMDNAAATRQRALRAGAEAFIGKETMFNALPPLLELECACAASARPVGGCRPCRSVRFAASMCPAGCDAADAVH